jgi:enediyne biosynthesis protein E11
MSVTGEVLADLDAEGDDLDRLVCGLTAAQWALPTPAPGWTIAHQVAHLASGDQMTTFAATNRAEFGAQRLALVREFEDFDAAVEARLAEQLAGTPSDLLARWRTQRAALQDALAAVPPGQKVPWIVMPMSVASIASARMMELFAHGQDIADALGVTRAPSPRLRHVARFGVRTRDFAYLARGMAPPAEEFRVELAAPGGGLWAYGPAGAAQRVSGPAMHFCLLVTRRRHRDDLALTAVGADAGQWLDIAQAYAGPPGPGRAPLSPAAKEHTGPGPAS